MSGSIFIKKPLDLLMKEAGETGENSLKRSLGPVSLVSLGVGAIIGAGIFVLTGAAAAKYAGPAIVLSFILAGIGCVFAGLCYAEFASLIPIAGSAYTYGYATLGELFAWIIGWDLILEYAFGAATVASGWSGYFTSLLQDFGIYIPPSLMATPGADLVLYKGHWQLLSNLTDTLKTANVDPSTLQHASGVFNLVAFIAICLVTTVLVIGIKESANLNNAIVMLKVSIVLVFIGVAGYFVLHHPEIASKNWHPFIPPNTGNFGEYGWSGVARGAGVIIFAYIGFDAVSTAAQETKNPQRDMPIAIIGSLLICTVLYILVSGIATGVVPYGQLDVPDPIALVADYAGLGWMGRLIKLGAIAGLSSVILVLLLGQSRVFYSMARDGLLPPFVSRVHPRFRTPWLTSIVTGVGVAIFAALFTVREAGSLCSIGTLLAFVIVSVGIIVLRVREPNLPRKFTTPWVWFVAPAGAISALLLMSALPWPTWRRLLVWFAIGIVFYFCYGVHRSKLAQPPTTDSKPATGG